MLRLRPYKKCDAEKIVKWIKDERTFHKWCADRFETYPLEAEQLNEYYEEQAYKDTFFAMTAFQETSIVGHLFMRFVDSEKKVLRFGFVVLDDAYRGKGYGKEMLLLALQYAFTLLKVEKVTLGVFENNPQAQHCYQSIGFQEALDENPTIIKIMGEEWKCLSYVIKKEMLKEKGGENRGVDD